MNKSIVSVSNPLNKAMVMFSIIVIVSGVLAFKPAASWEYKEVMLGWLMVYFLVIKIVNTERLVILFIAAYLLFNLKMAQFGSIIWVKRGFSFTDYGLNGAPGWFQNSGEYAIQMLIYGSLALAFVISLRGYLGRYKKWILYIAAIMGYLAVMGASSRGSQFALAIIAIWFLLKQKNGFKGLVIVGALSIVLFNLLPEEQIQRFQEVGEDGSSLQRLAYVEAGLEMMKEHPVLGVGYNNWISYMFYKYPEGVGPGQAIQVAHNIYIQAGSELGLVGLLCFLMMILYSFVNNTRTRKMARQIDNKLFFNLTYGLDAGLIGYLIAGTFVTVLYYPFFWVQIAMIVMLNSVTKNMWLDMTAKKQDNSSEEK
jgi:O-antigen ligase